MTRQDVLKKEFYTKIQVFDEYCKLSSDKDTFKIMSCEMVIRHANKHKELMLEIPQRIIDYFNKFNISQ